MDNALADLLGRSGKHGPILLNLHWKLFAFASGSVTDEEESSITGQGASLAES
jgi:hypothetical protein